MITVTEFIALAVGFSGFATAVFSKYADKPKTTAEVQNIVSDTYGDVVSMLREQQKINSEQITALMHKDTENQKLINKYRDSERELLKRVKELESEIEKLKTYNENIAKTTA